MGPKEREIQRRLRVLEHAEKIGNVCLTCRYFGLARSTFYRWKTEYDKQGETGLDEIEHIGSLLESYISTAENENSNIASGITYFESEATEPVYDCLKRRSVCGTPTLVVSPAVAKSRAIACRESPFRQKSDST